MDPEAAVKDESVQRGESSRRTVRKEIAIVLIGLAALALVHTLPVFSDIDRWGIEDWDQHFFYHAVARESIVSYKQVPLWNPYYCGGMPLLANPQSRVLAPTFPLVLWLDVVRGLKVEIWLNLAIGLAGTYLLARQLKLEGPAAVVVPIVYLLSSMYALIITSGATNFLSISWVPWTVWAFCRALERPRWAPAAGVFLAVTYFSGGHWVVPIVAVFLALFAVCSTATHGAARSVLVLAVTGVTAAAFGAIKVIPSVELMSRYPRAIDDYSGYTVVGMWQMLVDRDQRLARFLDYPQAAGLWRGITGEMSENGMYLGYAVLVLAALGIVACARKQWKWLVVVVAFVWLAFGNRMPLSLWEGFKRLPLCDTMQHAPRVRIILLLGLALFAGWGMQALHGVLVRVLGGQRRAGVACWAVVVFVAADLVLVSRPILASAFPIERETVMRDLRRRATFTQIARLPVYSKDGLRQDLDWFDSTPIEQVPVDTSYSALYPAWLTNRGTVQAYEAIPVEHNAVPFGFPGYRGEVYLAGGRGRAESASWSPNRIAVRVEATGSDAVVVNQNQQAGWVVQPSGAAAERSERGLLSAPVHEYTRQVVFAYQPRSFVIGAVVSGVTAVALAVFYVWVAFWREEPGEGQEGVAGAGMSAIGAERG